jgi:hypothetical protein
MRFPDRVAEQDRRTQPPRPHHHPSQGRWPQAALPHHRLQARQGRHRRRSSASSTIRTAPRTSRCCCYADGERRYIIAPKGSKVGDQLMAGRDAPIKVGNTLPLRNIPIGSTVHCIEMKPGKGAQLARAPAPRRSWLRANRVTRRCACAPAKCARCRPTAAPPSAKSATTSTACEKLGKAGAQALARHPPDRSRRGDEPGRPPARRR